MATQPQQSLNLFTQQPILGQAAFTNPGTLTVLQAVVSANQATALVPGQAIQFDSAIVSTPSGLPPIISASGTQYADGYILYDVKAGGALIAGVTLQIVLGGILWMLSEAAVNIGAQLQDGADAGGVATFATTSYYPRGVSLDYASAAGQLIRCNMQPAIAKAVVAAAHA